MKSRETSKVKWEEMFPDELYRKIQDEPVCYLAYGLAEPHGPYNALGLDWLKAYNLVVRAAHEFGGVVAPPFAWHIQEIPEFHDDGKGHGWFPENGVIQPLCSSIPNDLFYRLVFHQIRDIDARGFKAAFLVTGHYGGIEKTLRLICEYYTRRTGSPLRLFAIADWECIRYEDFKGDHAGICETSQLMALCPALVDLSRRTVPENLGTTYAGNVDFETDGRLPGRELGEKIIESQIAELGRTVSELLDSFQPRPNWKAPSQRDVDDIWHRFQNITQRYWIATLAEYKEKRRPEFPGWRRLANSRCLNPPG